MTAAVLASHGGRGRVLTNTAVLGVETLCQDGHEHLILKGRSKKYRMNWTNRGELPEPGLQAAGRFFVPAVGRDAGSVSACVLDSSKRLGEAKNSGPARRRVERSGSLFDVELIAKLTLESVWGVFRRWLDEHLAVATIVKVFACPPLLPPFGLVRGWTWRDLHKGWPPEEPEAGCSGQHLKIMEPSVVLFLQSAWRQLRPTDQLFPGSPGVFRRCWDKLDF